MKSEHFGVYLYSDKWGSGMCSWAELEAEKQDQFSPSLLKSSEENTIKMCCILLATYMAIFTSWRMEKILSLIEEWLEGEFTVILLSCAHMTFPWMKNG